MSPDGSAIFHRPLDGVFFLTSWIRPLVDMVKVPDDSVVKTGATHLGDRDVTGFAGAIASSRSGALRVEAVRRSPMLVQPADRCLLHAPASGGISRPWFVAPV